MCITTIPRPSRIECLSINNTANYFPGKELRGGWSITEGNCTMNDSSVTAITITEMDAINTVHSVEVNVTSGIDMGEVDVSQFNFPNSIWLVLPAWEVAVKSSAFAPVILGGILGNILLLSVLYKNKRLRTPTNLLIANMAFADLLTLLLSPWMLLMHHFYQNYILGAIGCKMEGFLAATFLTTGVMNLTAVSYDRLTAIVLPRETRITNRTAYRIIALTWLLGFIFAMPLCIWRTYKERQWKNFLETYCSENIQILPMYWHVLLSTLVWLPITVMVICYSAIFWKLDRYEQQILRRENPLSVSYKTKVAKTLFIVLITFIICRLPFTVLVFWRNKMIQNAQINSVQGSFQVLWFVSHYLMYLNCAINPIIYGLTNENYRKAFGMTPLYKWLSGNSKQTKEEVPKKTDTPESCNKKTQKKKLFCSIWPLGKKVLPSNENIKCENNQTKPKSPIIVCKKASIPSEGYI